MSEKRLPKRLILEKKGHKTVRKIEVFDGQTFAGRTFVDILGEPVAKKRAGLYRLRVDGKWFPARKKLLYTRDQLNQILISLIGE